MTRKLLSLIFLCCLMVGLIGTALAEDIYVKNKPFKGDVIGQGMNAEISLMDIGKALDLEVVSDNGRWTLGELNLPGRELDGKIYVYLSDLKKAGLTVIHSPELGTIDISVPKGERNANKGEDDGPPAADADWGGNKPTLVYFGAAW
jgi:hypothetical protein